MDCSNKYQCIIFGHIGLSFFWPQFRPVGVPPGGFKTESLFLVLKLLLMLVRNTSEGPFLTAENDHTGLF